MSAHLKAQIAAKMAPIIGKPRGWERVVRRILPMAACESLPSRWIKREGFAFLAMASVPIGYNLLFFGSYERELRELMRRHLGPGGVAVDIGANVGWHALLLARLVGGRGRVLAVEANPLVRQRLQQHLAANDITNTEVVPFAIGDVPGDLRFLAPSPDSVLSGDGHAMMESDDASPDEVVVKVMTLDTLVEEQNLHRLDFIKIDVEGFEWKVLTGGRKSLERFRPVVVFEFNSKCAWRGGGTGEAFNAFFESMRYEVAAIGRSGLRWLQTATWPDCANLLAIPRERRSKA